MAKTIMGYTPESWRQEVLSKKNRKTIEVEIYRDTKGEYRQGLIWTKNSEAVSDGYTRRGNCEDGIKNAIKAFAKGDYEIIIVPAGLKRPSVIRKEQRAKGKKSKRT